MKTNSRLYLMSIALLLTETFIEITQLSLHFGKARPVRGHLTPAVQHQLVDAIWAVGWTGEQVELSDCLDDFDIADAAIRPDAK